MKNDRFQNTSRSQIPNQTKLSTRNPKKIKISKLQTNNFYAYRHKNPEKKTNKSNQQHIKRTNQALAGFTPGMQGGLSI